MKKEEESGNGNILLYLIRHTYTDCSSKIRTGIALVRDINLNFLYVLATLLGNPQMTFDPFSLTQWPYMEAGAKVANFGFG
jgi:hypothetical protein